MKTLRIFLQFLFVVANVVAVVLLRSEERRVGKEC